MVGVRPSAEPVAFRCRLVTTSGQELEAEHTVAWLPRFRFRESQGRDVAPVVTERPLLCLREGGDDV